MQENLPSTDPNGPKQGFYARHERALSDMRDAGTLKQERVLGGRQGAVVTMADGSQVVNLCANNYLGLASDPRVLAAAREALATHGFGLSSVRFICGTQDLHKRLEARIASWLGTEDAILYGSAFDANGGLFETLLEEPDAVISDELNHASIIDGIRLSKASRYRYRHNDLDSLEDALRLAREQGRRDVLVFTDGVFSMDGTIANLAPIRALCDRYGALLGIDECHATGVLGASGRGTHELQQILGRVDIITGTFGKALGGACGGFTASSRAVVGVLRQRSRPYLFSNSLAPSVVAASLAAIDLLEQSPAMLLRLHRNTQVFRAAMQQTGLQIGAGHHPIVPVFVGDAVLAQRMSAGLLRRGFYAIGFSYPVVPLGKARIRVQISAAHEAEQLQKAADAMREVALECGVVA
jgi:glycine C-acetyltransferase